MRRNHLLRGGVIGMAAAFALAGCSGGAAEIAVTKGSTEAETVALDEASGLDQVAAATRKLGLDLIDYTEGEATVISPASAVVALGMLASGSDGEIGEQMTALLGAEGEERDQAINALLGTLQPYQGDLEKLDPKKLPETPLVHMANQVVIDKDFTPTDTYLDSLARWYDAGVLELDLADSGSKKVLDEWVRKNTAEMVKESAVVPNPDLRMVLQNAVLLAARWEAPFKADKTRNDDFHLADGSTVSVPTMHDDRNVAYSEVDGWKMIELPYDENLVARFILPPEGTKLSEVDVEVVDALEAALSREAVTIALPKLDITSTLDLKAPLQELGLTAPFRGEPGAFDYLSSVEDLVVTEVIQQGKVRLDEEGTIAAAVTEITLEAMAGNYSDAFEFIADRPHLVILHEVSSGWDLFDLVVYNPQSE